MAVNADFPAHCRWIMGAGPRGLIMAAETQSIVSQVRGRGTVFVALIAFPFGEGTVLKNGSQTGALRSVRIVTTDAGTRHTAQMSREKLRVFAIMAIHAKRRHTFRIHLSMRVVAGTAIVCCRFMRVL
jgi:hypothetical protein